MSIERFPILGHINQEELLQQIQLLQKELDEIQKETHSFEVLLRAHVSDLIVESQELFVLYKQIKKAKKAKRLEQKKRGKNYIAPQGLQTTSKSKKSNLPSDKQKEKRRLYREAMLHVHPDKFHMSQRETDVATEVTSRLIEIYKNENLETLQAYHTYIFKGNTHVVLSDTASKVKLVSEDNYLQKEKESLEKDIALAKDYHLYKVITEYDNPLTFVSELKEYYVDRIFKLKKRTRKGR